VDALGFDGGYVARIALVSKQPKATVNLSNTGADCANLLIQLGDIAR
jgi:hypothetical protein